MSITPSRCQGCGASFDLVQTGAVCPYCGRSHTTAQSDPASVATPLPVFPADTHEPAGVTAGSSWFEQCLRYFNRAISRYARFSGRASRAEYWYFFLAVLLMNIAFALLAMVFAESVLGDVIDLLSGIFLLFVLIPSLSIGVRRLHDVNKSGWWYGLILIPLVGPLVLLYWAVKPGDAHGNAYGEAED